MGQVIIASFLLGILGSFHCVGMCGPIALSLPLQTQSIRAKVIGALLYNIGRIVTYAGFGLVFGVVGKSVAFFGYQQWLSIAVGVLILIVLLVPKKYALVKQSNGITKFLSNLRGRLQKLLTQKNYNSLFFIGLLNGLLPCGLVYMAAAGAIATANLGHSILFMIFFGLGTLPIMWSIAFLGNYISINIRSTIRKMYPFVMGIMACLFIVRGMGIGIPYISPKVEVAKKEVHGCCAKPQ
ncbi:MAG: sulfite exporter TauE/SafE family protein [Ferruginibacter sp.]|nr:sulfite exporter TauE/SafE family protein [Ferruginibacter sp.]